MACKENSRSNLPRSRRHSSSVKVTKCRHCSQESTETGTSRWGTDRLTPADWIKETETSSRTSWISMLPSNEEQVSSLGTLLEREKRRVKKNSRTRWRTVSTILRRTHWWEGSSESTIQPRAPSWWVSHTEWASSRTSASLKTVKFTARGVATVPPPPTSVSTL